MTVGYQNRNAYSAHLDLGGQVDEEKTFGYRLNLLDEEGEGYVRNSKIRRQLAAVALDWQIRPGTQIQLDASHYHFVTKGFPAALVTARILIYRMRRTAPTLTLHSIPPVMT